MITKFRKLLPAMGKNKYSWGSKTRTGNIRHHVFHRTKQYHRHASVGLVVLMLFSISLTYLQLPAVDVYADTGAATLVPDGDHGTTNNFALNSGASDSSCAGGTHCDYVDEDGETDYLNTGTDMNGTTAEEEFTFSNPTISGTLQTVDRVDVIVRADIIGACQGGGGSNCDGMNVRLFIDGAYNGTTGSTANITTTPQDYTYTWSGLSEPTADDIRVEIQRVAQGGGGASGSDDDFSILDVRAEIDYTFLPAPPEITQEDYIFENDDTDTSSEGFTITGTGANDTDFPIGTIWSAPTDIENEGADSAQVTLSQNGTSRRLEATNFGFNIPSGSTILGVEFEYATYYTHTGLTTLISADAQLMKAGTQSGSLRGMTWPDDTSPQTGTSGGAADLWGNTLTPSDVNNTNFGVSIQVDASSDSGTVTPHIDYVKLKIHYEIPSTALAGSQFTSPKTLDTVKKGERVNLRMHLKNTGAGAVESADELALFYDRNDDIWTRVSAAAPFTTTGNCLDTSFECTSVDVTDDIGGGSSIAIGQDGRALISYFDLTNSTLFVAEYVGSGGSGCGGGSTEWSCETVESNYGIIGEQSTSIAIASDGTPWIASTKYNGLFDVRASVCSKPGAVWTCEAVDDSSSSMGWDISLAFDSLDTPWISYRDAENHELRVARRNGGGSGNCTDTDWNCESVDTSGTDAIGDYTSIAIAPTGVPWVSYYDGGTESKLKVASRDGGGTGSCSDTDWNCESVDDTGTDTGSHTSIAIAPDGIPWVSYYDTTNANLRVAHRETSGFGSACTDTDWYCGAADSTGTVGLHTSISFAPDGNAWISYYDDDATADNKALKYIRHVGTGGSGCADAAWDGCSKIDSAGTDEIGEYSSLAFDHLGNAWISYYDGGTQGDIKVATLKRFGEIVIATSQAKSNGDVLTESRADMGSATDTTDRDDADCISVSTTWNNGIYFGSEIGSGLSLPAGDTTAQCTEVMWTLDTSQTTPGTTYRFVVATKDSFNPSKGFWRGPIQIDEYPTLTIADSFEQETRYSKTIQAQFTNCTNTDWGCVGIDSGSSSSDDISIDFKADGTPVVAYHVNDISVGGGLVYGEYTGDSADTCLSVLPAGWRCTTIHLQSLGQLIGENADITVSRDGTIGIAYYSAEDSNSLWYAEYVGTGGTGCDVTSWTCTQVQDGTSNVGGSENSLVYDRVGNPYIGFTGAVLSGSRVARYIGGTSGNCTATAWECVSVSTGTNSDPPRLAVNDNGEIQGAYISNIGTNSIVHFKYVGSGGSCGGGSWSCTTVYNPSNNLAEPDIAINNIGNPVIAAKDENANSIYFVEYVGGGSGTGCTGGSSDWNCTLMADDATNVYTDQINIEVSPDGIEHIVYIDSTAGDVMLATYVGSGGSGCGSAGSSAWECNSIESGVTTRAGDIAFDHDGVAWIAYNETSASVDLAKQHIPINKLSGSRNDSSPSGDYRYLLTPGRSPATSTGVNCTSNSTYAGYCGLLSDNGDVDSIVTANEDEMPLYGLATKSDVNSILPKAYWSGVTNVAPSTTGTAGDIVMEAYNHNTGAWVEIARDNSSSDCTSNCKLTGEPAGTPANFYETINSEYWLYIRVYQVPDGTNAITFQIDAFSAAQLSTGLGNAGFFREGIELPLNVRR